MATFTSVFTPLQAAGNLNDIQQVANLGTTTASSNITVSKRYIIAISVVPGSTSGATIGANVRFSLSTGSGTATAGSGDFTLPLNTVTTWDMGENLDTLNFYNPNGTGTLTINIMRLSRTS